MLTLLIGDFGTGKSEYIYEKIAERTKERQPSFLIVPEQATAMTERLLASRTTADAPLYFEVTNFSRFANTVFRRLGGLAAHAETAEARAALMWRTLYSVRAFMASPPALIDGETVRRYLNAYDELCRSGVDENALTSAYERMKEGEALRDKLSDYLLVCRTYASLLAERGDESTDELSRLAALLTEHPIFADTPIYLDGFVSLTGSEMQVLRALLSQSASVTVSISMPCKGRTSIAYAEARDTVRLLRKTAEELGVVVETRSFENTYRPTPSVFHEISAHLFTGGKKEQPLPLSAGTDAPITVMECPDVFEECEAIATHILTLVREKGVRYRDIFVVGGDVSAYKGILDASLARCGIPFFFSEKTDVTLYEPIKMILSAYAMRAEGYATSDVVTYLKCGFSGIPRRTVGALEMYMQTWHLHGDRFTSSEPLTMHLRGYSDVPMTEDERALLSELDLARRQMQEPLALLGDAHAICTVREHSEKLIAFLEALGVEARLLSRSESERAAGRLRESEDYRSLYGVICASLDSTVSCAGELSISEREYAALLSTVFSFVSVGQIPSGADEVTVGRASMMRPISPVYTVMLGANEGRFPAVMNGGGFFTEQEKSALACHGATLDTEWLARASRERYAFLRAFTSPREGLLITVPHASSGRGALEMSEAVRDLLTLGGSSVRYRTLSEFSACDTVTSRANALLAYGMLESKDERARLLSLIGEDEAYAERVKALSRPIVDMHAAVSRNASELYLTQSRIDSFVRCPFAYSCQYELGLREEAEAGFHPAEAGTFVHAMLEHFFADIEKQGRTLADVPQSERIAMLDGIAARYVRRLLPDASARNDRFDHACKRLKAATLPTLTSLEDEFEKSLFRPFAYEKAIGGDGEPQISSLKTEKGTPIRLYGRIDRADICKLGDTYYLRVIDYKTGKKTFDAKDVEKGVNLQLLIYLDAMTDKSNASSVLESIGAEPDATIEPAGALYVMTGEKRAKLKRASEAKTAHAAASLEVARSGIVREDEEIRRAMEGDIGSGILTKIGKNGRTLKKEGIFAVSAEEMQETLGAMRESVKRIADDMETGNANITPLIKGTARGGSCSYCAYKPICRNAVYESGEEDV